MRMTLATGSALVLLGLVLVGCNKVDKVQASPSDYVLTVEGMH